MDNKQLQNYLLSLSQQAEFYHRRREFRKAIKLSTRACDLAKKHFSGNFLVLAYFYNDLGVLHYWQGNFTDAKPLFIEALECYQRGIGIQTGEFAMVLKNLADVNTALGDFKSAEAQFLQTIDIQQRAFGDAHPQLAETMNNLGLLYLHIGDHAHAEPLFKKSKNIWEKTDHPNYPTSLNNLGLLYETIGNSTQAEKYYKKALALEQSGNGVDSESTVATLSNLGTLYLKKGDIKTAKSFLNNALRIDRATSKNHPNLAFTLGSMTILMEIEGNLSEAESFARQEKEIIKKHQGEYHLSHGVCLLKLARFACMSKRIKEGLKLIQKGLTIFDRYIDHIFSFASESQRLSFLSLIKSTIDLYLSIVLTFFPDSPALIQSAAELVLRRKAISLEATAAQRKIVLEGNYPELKNQLDILDSLKCQIAQKSLAGHGEEGFKEHQNILIEWNKRKDEIESYLARNIPEIRIEREQEKLTLKSIKKYIPKKGVLVEFICFRMCAFELKPQGSMAHEEPAHYAACIIHAEKRKATSLIDLGPAESINSSIGDFLTKITREAWDIDYADVGNELRKIIFDPLLTSMGTSKRILLATDGDITRVPFEVLTGKNGSLLIDEYHFSYLSVGRDLIHFGEVSGRKATDPLIIADPDFNLGSGEGQDNTRFKRLPGTKDEGFLISKMIGGQFWNGADALEGKLKNIISPRILHIATHGFFLENKKRLSESHLSLKEGVAVPDRRFRYTLANEIFESPMLCSGLVLAGVNTWLSKKTPPPEAEDGILTAEDVTSLNLLDTDLVVLSACETGLGDIQPGEGVFGLRRAFVIAGSKTLVMSLWKVPDQQTKELMVKFYQKILAGRARSEALRESQLELKKKFPHPLYWGAFICQGDPGLLNE